MDGSAPCTYSLSSYYVSLPPSLPPLAVWESKAPLVLLLLFGSFLPSSPQLCPSQPVSAQCAVGCSRRRRRNGGRRGGRMCEKRDEKTKVLACLLCQRKVSWNRSFCHLA